MAKKFDYQGAKQAGYSDAEISEYLSQQHPNFDLKSAQESGYSPEEINEYLSDYKQKQSPLKKAGKVASQFALGAAESAAFPYEIATLPLAIPGGQEALGDLFTRDILSEVYPTEEEGKQVEPRELKEPIDIGIRGLAEKATGLDLHPEEFLEKAANWIGFIKNPKNAKELIKLGSNPKELIKSILPTGKETLRGLGAGAALQMAQEGDFGPIGAISAAVVGDLLGGGVASGIKGISSAVRSPKQALAKGLSKAVKSESLEAQKELIKEFRDLGIQADAGTLTDQRILQAIQTKLSQSGLTGKPLEDFRKQLTSEIKQSYNKLADEIGELRFSTSHEASEVGKEFLTSIRDTEKQRIGKLYEEAKNALPENASINPITIAKKVSELEKALKPGSIKSTEQKAVLDVLEKLKNDIYTETGELKSLRIEDLLNNKIALNDIINFEVQGGQKQLLKGLVSELDKAALSYGSSRSGFSRKMIQANSEFSDFAKTYRNKNIDQILRSQDPMAVMNKMNTVQGIRDLQKALSISPEGKKYFNDLKRLKFEQMIGNKMTDNVSEQLKLGTFSNLLKNPKDKQLALELLGKKGFSRLERLQKATGKLAQTAQKFLNASQSGVAVIDAGVIAEGLRRLSYLLSGNPWPFLRFSGGIVAARRFSKLLADPEFLKLLEEAILASEKNNTSKLLQIGKSLEEPLKAAIGTHSNQEGNQ